MTNQEAAEMHANAQEPLSDETRAPFFTEHQLVAAFLAGVQFAEDRLATELDPAVCRLQFPDGSVPGNAREAAEGWKRWYDELRIELAAERSIR